jgi:hypothetical protein
MVTINPNERLEYLVSIATRDMKVGDTYSVEAYFPNFEQLRKSVSVSAINTPPPTATPAPKNGSGTPAPVAPANLPEKHKKM